MKRLWSTLVCPALVLCATLTTPEARAASPTVAAVSPRGAQRGTEAELTFSGDRLSDAQEVLLYAPGITVDKLEVVNNTTVKAIESANPGIDPNHLKIGQIVHLPAAGTGTAAPTSTLALGASSTPTTRPSASGSRSSASATPTRSLKPGSSYTIKKGDSLQTIAQATYGNKTAWKRIFRANRSELGDANTIPVGTTIRLPE